MKIKLIVKKIISTLLIVFAFIAIYIFMQNKDCTIEKIKEPVKSLQPTGLEDAQTSGAQGRLDNPIIEDTQSYCIEPGVPINWDASGNKQVVEDYLSREWVDQTTCKRQGPPYTGFDGLRAGPYFRLSGTGFLSPLLAFITSYDGPGTWEHDTDSNYLDRQRGIVNSRWREQDGGLIIRRWRK